MALVPYEFDAERFSRWMSYVLRHNPLRYGLQPDQHGFVDLEEFVMIAKGRYPSVSDDRLRSLIESGGAGCFEITGDRLRARYGHSIAIEPAGSPVTPPPRLYHGTEVNRSATILSEGLKPLERRMLHLSETVADAFEVARRKTDHPVVIRVQADDAHRAGIAFYREGKVYLASCIPGQFLSLESLPDVLPASS